MSEQYIVIVQTGVWGFLKTLAPISTFTKLCTACLYLFLCLSFHCKAYLFLNINALKKKIFC